jgi:hypothetical protein
MQFVLHMLMYLCTIQGTQTSYILRTSVNDKKSKCKAVQLQGWTGGCVSQISRHPAPAGFPPPHPPTPQEIQGLSKRFERFKFGIFYLLIVKIRYNFSHK